MRQVLYEGNLESQNKAINSLALKREGSKMEHTLKFLKDRMQNHERKRHTWCSKIGGLYWDTLKECKMLRNLLSNYVAPTKFVSIMKFGVKENIYVTIVSRNNDRNKRKHLYKNYFEEEHLVQKTLLLLSSYTIHFLQQEKVNNLV